MKKTTLALLALITFYTFAIGKKPVTPQNLKEVKPAAKEVAEQPKTLLNAGTVQSTVDSSSVADYLARFNAWNERCGKEGLALIKEGKGMGIDVVKEFKDLPPPTTQEAVKQWTDKIDMVFGGLGSILVALLTYLLSLFKKDPTATIGKVQEVFNKIRTRYLLAISAIAVAAFGTFYFSDGKVGFGDILSGLGLALGVTIGGIGIKGLAELFGINIGAKKV